MRVMDVRGCESDTRSEKGARIERTEARSDLFPARAITMLGLPCLCSSLTQLLALAKESGLVMS